MGTSPTAPRSPLSSGECFWSSLRLQVYTRAHDRWQSIPLCRVPRRLPEGRKGLLFLRDGRFKTVKSGFMGTSSTAPRFPFPSGKGFLYHRACKVTPERSYGDNAGGRIHATAQGQSLILCLTQADE